MDTSVVSPRDTENRNGYCVPGTKRGMRSDTIGWSGGVNSRLVVSSLDNPSTDHVPVAVSKEPTKAGAASNGLVPVSTGAGNNHRAAGSRRTAVGPPAEVVPLSVPTPGSTTMAATNGEGDGVADGEAVVDAVADAVVVLEADEDLVAVRDGVWEGVGECVAVTDGVPDGVFVRVAECVADGDGEDDGDDVDVADGVTDKDGVGDGVADEVPEDDAVGDRDGDGVAVLDPVLDGDGDEDGDGDVV